MVQYINCKEWYHATCIHLHKKYLVSMWILGLLGGTTLLMRTLARITLLYMKITSPCICYWVGLFENYKLCYCYSIVAVLLESCCSLASVLLQLLPYCPECSVLCSMVIAPILLWSYNPDQSRLWRTRFFFGNKLLAALMTAKQCKSTSLFSPEFFKFVYTN